MHELVLIALGGNAIKTEGERGTFEQQYRNVYECCKGIAKIIKEGYRVVITHGNGPQVGNLLIQQEEAAEVVPPQPLHVCVAMTQGQIGYMIQQALGNRLKELGAEVPVVSLITQILVDKEDPDFKDPHKPIGPFYDEATARRYAAERGYVIKRVRPVGSKQYRRVVPSPEPLEVVELRAVKTLVEAEVVVIAAGGGGVPVIEEDGLRGVDAVIDKDLAGERLAEALKADVLMILTDVDRVYLHYGKPAQMPINEMSVVEARRYLEEGHFLKGSMEPKVRACVRFLEKGGKRAIIAHVYKAYEALKGIEGTHILP